MLPPSATGCAGSAARTAAMSDEVVVLPFVPVTPIVGAGQRRRNRSASDTSTGVPLMSPARRATSAFKASLIRGSVVEKSGLIDGDVPTSAAPAQALSGARPG